MSHFGSNKDIVSLNYPTKLLLSGTSACCAATCVHPLDVTKLNMQVDMGKRVGVFRTLAKMYRTGGLLYFTRGLSACWSRHLIYSSIRIGTYPVFKEWLAVPGKDYLPLSRKILASASSGVIGSFLASPNDLILTRMAAGNELGYRNVFDGIWRTLKSDGVFGLWRGAAPCVLRGMVVNGSQVASYDQIKQILMTKTQYFKDDLLTHFTSASIAGWICTTLSSPVDVIKTRMMNMKPSPSTGELPYTSVVDCARKIWSGEGPRGFYKGYVPNLTRIVPITILIFLFYEQIFKLYLRVRHKDVYGAWKEENRRK